MNARALVALGLALGYLAGVASSIAFSSHAEEPARVDVGTGFCKHNRLQDGTWFQGQYGFSGKLSSPCLELQRNQLVFENFGYSLGLAHLGYLHSNNIATIHDGDTVDGACDPATGHNCRAIFETLGSDYGVTAGLYAEGERWGRTWALETGLLGYRSSIDITVHRGDVVPDALFPAEQREHVVAWHLSPYVGGVARFRAFERDWYARLRVYLNVRQDGHIQGGDGYLGHGALQAGLTHGPVTVFSLGATF